MIELAAAWQSPELLCHRSMSLWETDMSSGSLRSGMGSPKACNTRLEGTPARPCTGKPPRTLLNWAAPYLCGIEARLGMERAA